MRSLKILGVNLLLILIGFTSLELVYGNWGNGSQINKLSVIKDRTLYFATSHLYDSNDPIIEYSRDKYGLRGNHHSVRDIDILTIGGSTTDQRYIADGQTWQDVLQNRFRESKIDITIANAGADGQSTIGHLKNFDWWFPHIPELTPKYVLFYVGINDFYKPELGKFDKILIENTTSGLETYIKYFQENSAIWHLARKAKGMYLAYFTKKIYHQRIIFEQQAWTSTPILEDYSFMDIRLNEYEFRIKKLIEKSKEIGAFPIFVSQPSRKYKIESNHLLGISEKMNYGNFKYNGVDYRRMTRRLDKVTQQVALNNGAIFVDLAMNTDWSDMDFYDWSHSTPSGTEKIGDFLFDELKTVLTFTNR